MYFLVLGLTLLVMKYLEFGPVANWSWLAVFAPFGLAVVWWAWADASGYTKRKVMEKENARRKQRIDKNKEAMGTLNKRRR
ncbi:MAG: TIGR04438 family Trp-rich protein [Burkholderiales bacterium]|nr:TIGR04438 family Trp-rich protein [Burkholderiales bacterium]